MALLPPCFNLQFRKRTRFQTLPLLKVTSHFPENLQHHRRPAVPACPGRTLLSRLLIGQNRGYPRANSRPGPFASTSALSGMTPRDRFCCFLKARTSPTRRMPLLATVSGLHLAYHFKRQESVTHG